MNKKVKNLTFITALTIAIVLIGGSIFAAVASILIPNNFLKPAEAAIDPFDSPRSPPKAPSVVTGDNVYVVWWNGTAGLPDVQTDVMFRASTDGGETFGDRINLSNTTDSDSADVEIAAEGDNVIVSWWETTGIDVSVARVSNDAGETFGPVLMLGTNGTIGVTEEEEGGGAEEEEATATAADEGGG